MLPDGSDQRMLAQFPQSPGFGAYLASPRYSADGSRLAVMYVQNGEGTNCGVASTSCVSIVLMNSDGTDQKTILATDQIGARAMALSPNGRTVAFSLSIGGTEWLHTMEVRGKKIKALYKQPAPWTTDMFPTWSPDGRRIAFDSDRFCCELGSWSLMTVDVRNGRVRRVMAAGGNDLYPDWSPDGARLLFVRTYAYPDYRIVSVGVDGYGESELVSGYTVHTPVWSPDGQRIAFFSDGMVLVADTSGENLRALASGEWPAWQPIPDPNR